MHRRERACQSECGRAPKLDGQQAFGGLET